MRDLPTPKEQLEIQKLQLDIRHANRSFWVQVTHVLALIAIALVGFYFVHRPQIDLAEASRAAIEKQQVANLLISAQGLSSDAEKKNMIEILARMYPEYDFVAKVAQSTLVIAQGPPAGNARAIVTQSAGADVSAGSGVSANECEPVRARVAALEASERDLASGLRAEQASARDTPVAKSLRLQLDRTARQISLEKTRLQSPDCQ
jgi:hypothetical protein